MWKLAVKVGCNGCHVTVLQVAGTKRLGPGLLGSRRKVGLRLLVEFARRAEQEDTWGQGWEKGGVGCRDVRVYLPQSLTHPPEEAATRQHTPCSYRCLTCA